MKQFNFQEAVDWLEQNPDSCFTVQINLDLKELANNPSRKRKLKLQKSIMWMIHNEEFRKATKI